MVAKEQREGKEGEGMRWVGSANVFVSILNGS